MKMSNDKSEEQKSKCQTYRSEMANDKSGNVKLTEVKWQKRKGKSPKAKSQTQIQTSRRSLRAEKRLVTKCEGGLFHLYTCFRNGSFKCSILGKNDFCAGQYTIVVQD